MPVVNTYMSCSLYLLYHFIGSKRLNEWKLHLAYDLILYFILFWIFFCSFPNYFFLINYSLSRRILKYYAYNFDGMLYLLDLISIKMHTALMIPKSFIDFEFDCSQYVLYTADFYFLCQIKYFISSLYFCLFVFFWHWSNVICKAVREDFLLTPAVMKGFRLWQCLVIYTTTVEL